MSLKPTLKTQILQGLNAISDKAEDPAALRERWAETLSTAIDTSIKQAFTQVINAGVPVPQDGGAGLKATMSAAINSI